ncbi:MAG: hypothetical protein J0I12_11065 [Candidatus Eremiobacteraeota bacterium]|nr:hypothetical protein [Candidatus Eremiobacteraeota bacterium]
MSTPGQFQPGKLLDFFRYFDPKKPQHVEAARRLERSLTEKAPELLNDEAYWVKAFRTQPPKPKLTTLVDVSVQNKVKVQPQHHADSCGQTSAAMAINALTGKSLTDDSFHARYGYELLKGLRKECPGWEWWDAGDISADQWDDVERCLQAGGVPIGAGNGPGFSSGAGHIMCIVALKGDKVVVADPNGGYFRTVTRQQWENAARHPQGNFLFLCKRIQ